MTRSWLARLALAWALLPGAAAAEPSPLPGGIPLADVLEILVFEREIIAVNAEGGGGLAIGLRRAEQVLWYRSRGAVGVVITDQRLLAVSARSGAWQQTDWQQSETPPAMALLGERVALVTTSTRAVGFDGGSGNFVESRIGPREAVIALRVGENVGLVVTDRRALGLSPFAGGFFGIKLDLGDPVREVEARANLATITTDHRLLTFRAPSGTWVERNLMLR